MGQRIPGAAPAPAPVEAAVEPGNAQGPVGGGEEQAADLMVTTADSLITIAEGFAASQVPPELTQRMQGIVAEFQGVLEELASSGSPAGAPTGSVPAPGQTAPEAGGAAVAPAQPGLL